jgi:hypothetical protein
MWAWCMARCVPVFGGALVGLRSLRDAARLGLGLGVDWREVGGGFWQFRDGEQVVDCCGGGISSVIMGRQGRGRA